MRLSLFDIAQEAIDSQGPEFFQELTRACKEAQNIERHLSNEAFAKDKRVLKISRLIQERTGVRYLICATTPMVGPATEIPLINNNHPLIDNAQKELMRAYGNMAEKNAMRWLRLNKKTFLTGTVDLKKARVGGAFADMVFPLYIPRICMQDEQILTAAQLAAVILHELGHVFTWFEYFNRAMTTNLALLIAVEAQKQDDEKTRVALIAKSAEVLEVAAKEMENDLGKVKSPYALSALVLGKAVEASRSDLGCNIFDMTGSEFLADQFAGRFGASRDLVLALENLDKMGMAAFRSASIAVKFAYAIGFLLMSLVMVAAVCIYLLTFMATFSLVHQYEIPIHNTVGGRYTRIANELAQQARNKDLTADQRQQIIQDYEMITMVARRQKDVDLNVLSKIAYYINPNFRKKRNAHQLQKDLEDLASSRLYITAAKLSAT